MAVPEVIFDDAIEHVDDDKIYLVDCPECDEFKRNIDYSADEEEEAMHMARRKIGSHFAQKHDVDSYVPKTPQIEDGEEIQVDTNLSGVLHANVSYDHDILKAYVVGHLYKTLSPHLLQIEQRIELPITGGERRADIFIVTESTKAAVEIKVREDDLSGNAPNQISDYYKNDIDTILVAPKRIITACQATCMELHEQYGTTIVASDNFELEVWN